MKKNHRCSLQYHRFKDETFIVLEGRLRLYYGIDKTNLIIKDLNPGDYFHIPITTIHRMEGIEDSIYIECSTNNLDDVVRIEDEYGRV
jgi:quercetin dioxygenase-like cupin family protein